MTDHFGCDSARIQPGEISLHRRRYEPDVRDLAKMLGGEPVKFDELVEMARANGLFERIIGSDSDGDLRPSDKSRYGKLLSRYDRRLFNGDRRFVIDGKGRTRTFRVVRTGRTGCTGLLARSRLVHVREAR